MEASLPSFTTAIEALGTPLSVSIFAAAPSIFLLTSGEREFVSSIGDNAGEGVGSLMAQKRKKKKNKRKKATGTMEYFLISSDFLNPGRPSFAGGKKTSKSRMCD